MDIRKIYDLNGAMLSERNGMYGGMAGLKEGIVFNNENWLITYPKSTRIMKEKCSNEHSEKQIHK